MRIEKNFLTFLINPDGPSRLMVFYVDGEAVVDYALPVTPKGNKKAYVDVRRFKGRNLTWKIIPELIGVETCVDVADEMPLSQLYAAKDRQLVHFTPPFGQMNDPNGLVFYEGKYHAFYQYYPPSPRVSKNDLWRRHEWGHAVSEDLLHWEQWEEALFHSPIGSPWSGSAVVDRNNVTKLKENEHDPLLLFYTACGLETGVSKGDFEQRMSYSIDGGRTFKLYPHVIVPNMVVDRTIAPIDNSNRDPKVEWCEELNAYLLAIYSGVRHTYLLFRSDNLLDWKHLQNYEIEGDSECPDLYPLIAGDGRRLWVLSGADHGYLVGEMGKDGFQAIQEKKKLVNKGDGYAGQTFYGADKRIHIDWIRLPYEKGSDYWGGFSLPTEISLKKFGEEYFLCENLVDVSSAVESEERFPFADVDKKLSNKHAYVVTIDAENCSEKTLLDVFGIFLEVDGRVARMGDWSLKRCRTDGRLRVTAVYDYRSVEIFFDDGEVGFTVAENCLFEDCVLHVRAPKNAKGMVTVKKLKKLFVYR